MKNVYDLVHNFYSDDLTSKAAITKEWAEGFLRQKAWQGCSDRELQRTWHHLELFIMYLIQAEIDDLNELTHEDYILVLEWLVCHDMDFNSSRQAVTKLFETLHEFYKFLAAKKIISGMSELESAIGSIAADQKDTCSNLLGNKLKILDSQLFQPDRISPPLGVDIEKVVGQAIQNLMTKLGNYFQKEQFSKDFERALYLFTGPIDVAPTLEQADFWLGFWDYFLFDYHLLSNDQVPIKHFSTVEENNLTPDERRILRDLLNSQFTVFYIDRPVNEEWLRCVNLFTNESFELPYPDISYGSLKKMLFFGHMCNDGIVMLNYITSIEVSSKLRARIRDEVLRQKELYCIQHPGAGLTEFFQRHALVVRHTIDALVSLARVNVTPIENLNHNFPEISRVKPVNETVIELLRQVRVEYGLSKHDEMLMERLWCDYYQLSEVIVRKTAVWVAALIYTYMRINQGNMWSIELLAKSFNVSANGVATNYKKIWETLELRKLDPRYLNEEGFVLSIYLT